MSNIVLFSPVGGTDPISATNAYDGSLLHICRFYKPDKVILYMSAEVLGIQEKDDRYRFCLNKLMQLQEHEMMIEQIKRPELTEVQDFDYFYDDFRNVLKSIYANLNEDDELLLNVSSGTPAMKSTLMVLGTFGEIPCRLIQVATPVRKMNEHQHKDYDVEMLWELNEDNNETTENRCSEIHCPSLLMLKQEEMIKQHVTVYNYQAALSVANIMPGVYTRRYKPFLQLANYRVQMNLSEAIKIKRSYNIPIQFLKDENESELFEYALTLQVKLARKEYADFIRAVSPLIVDLFELALKENCNIDIRQYMKGKNWSEEKLKSGTQQAKQIMKAFENGYGGKTFNLGFLKSDHLKILINEFSEDKRLKQLTTDIREVENEIRNVAAHEVVSISDEYIKRRTGFSSTQIMQMLRDMFSYAGITIKGDWWKAYDDLNAMIIEAMS